MPIVHPTSDPSRVGWTQATIMRCDTARDGRGSDTNDGPRCINGSSKSSIKRPRTRQGGFMSCMKWANTRAGCLASGATSLQSGTPQP